MRASLPQAEGKPLLLPGVLPKLERAISPVTHVMKLGHGVASWYGKALDRHRTANGEIFDSARLTGASNSLPMGSQGEGDEPDQWALGGGADQ